MFSSVFVATSTATKQHMALLLLLLFLLPKRERYGSLGYFELFHVLDFPSKTAD